MPTEPYATHPFEHGSPEHPNCVACDRPESEHVRDFEFAIVLLNDARHRLVVLSERFAEERARLLAPETELRRMYEINRELVETHNRLLGRPAELERRVAQLQAEVSALLVKKRTVPPPDELVDLAASVAVQSFFGADVWSVFPPAERSRWVRLATAVLALTQPEVTG